MRLFALLTVCLAIGCSRSAADAQGDGGARGTQSSQQVDGGFVLTTELLDRWLRYHRALVPAPDAGKRDLQTRARAEAAVRRDAGLTEDEINAIEDIVAQVIPQREISRLVGGEALRAFERATASLSAQQKAPADKALSDMRARVREVESLSAERARFGDAGVDIILSRESEVTAVWNAIAEARAE